MERYELPEGWEWKWLSKFVACLESGSRPRGGVSKYTFGIPSISAEQINDDGEFNWNSIKYVPNNFYEQSKKGLIQINDILIVKDGATSGKCAFIDSIFPYKRAMVNEHTFILRTNCNMYPKFTFYYLKSPFCADYFNAARQRGVIGGITNKFPEELEIPVPPLAEQRRIARRIEEQVSRIEEINNLQTKLEKEFNETLLGTYSDVSKNAEYKPMADVAPLVRRPVKVELSKSYLETGIRSFGKGTFHKPALSGKQLGSKRIFRIEEGDLLFNIVFAWEGAVAVAKPKDRDRVGSHRFLTCVPIKGVATSPFLCFHFLTERGLHDLGDASPGGAGRNRTLGLKALDKIKVPVPRYEKQVWFSTLWAKLNTARELQNEISTELAAFTPALLAKAFRGEL